MVLKRQNQKPSGPPVWMISFTDVISLMLTFFVLLFAMSEPKTEEWNLVTGVLRDSFGLHAGSINNPGEANQRQNILDLEVEDALDLNYLGSVIERRFKDGALGKNILINRREDTLIITLPSDLVFRPGNASISDKGRDTIDLLTGMLSKIDNQIDIYGHADERVINTKTFPSNWELALWRAEAVSNAFQQAGYKRVINTFSMGNTRAAEIPQQLSEEQRTALARRVDIVVRDDRGVRR